MNTVQPIRDQKQIRTLKNNLRDKDEKYYIMFTLGINVGLRVSDVLKLKVGDILGKTHVVVIEQKTGKTKRFFMNEKLQKEIAEYVEKRGYGADNYLMQSRKGENKPISRVQAYRVLNECAEGTSITEIGTHTMRKTFGYWHYKQFHDVATLQKLFNHASPSITLRYIGITDEEIDKQMQKFYI